jgi:hypothetical protein
LTEIDKAVHLGVGTFDPNDGLNLDGKRSTFAQLAAFEIMVEELGTSTLIKLYMNGTDLSRENYEWKN